MLGERNKHYSEPRRRVGLIPASLSQKRGASERYELRRRSPATQLTSHVALRCVLRLVASRCFALRCSRRFIPSSHLLIFFPSFPYLIWLTGIVHVQPIYLLSLLLAPSRRTSSLLVDYPTPDLT